MTHDEAFLEDVVAHPDDDAPRLIYADWLDDHGRSEADRDQAAFIRVQCRLARLGEDDPQREGLLEQEASLLRKHRRLWEADLPARGCEFRRGFVAALTLEAELWLARAAELASRAPLEKLALGGAGP